MSDELGEVEDWGRVAKYKPTAPPVFEHRNREAKLRQPYVGIWFNSVNVPVAITPYGCHLRKRVENTLRKFMHDASTGDVNHHTRCYIWDTSLPWNPNSLHCWTPIAARPRDQWVPSR